jgi:AraC-like DNA-binding protein
MHTLQSSLYATAITSCLLYLFIAHRGSSASAGWSHRYLVAYLALESGSFVLEWLMLQPTSPGKSLWLGLLMASSFLMAPCLWLFAREITEGAPPPLRSIPRTQWAVIMIGFALTLPLIQRSYWGPHFGDPTDPAGPAHRLFIQTTMALCAALFLIQVPFYLRACVRILRRQASWSKAVLSSVEPRALHALRLLIFVVFVNWMVSLFRVLHCMLLGVDTGWGIVFALLEVSATVGIVFLLARRNSTFAPEDRQLARELEDPATETPKYARSALDDATRARIRRKLDQAADELHMDSRLSLRALSAHIRENPHYVSQVINQDLRTNFHDLINGRRIESSKAALIRFPGKTILEIAMEAGFNSKSTFNTAFRQHVGMTPTEFRRRPPAAMPLAAANDQADPA